MTDAPLYRWSATALARGIADGEVSAEEVMRVHLDRIAEVEGDVAAFVSLVSEDDAIQMAREADRAVARGDRLGPLHGLPTGVKDLIDVAGLPTSHGSEAYRDAGPASHDSLLAANLRRAGALIIGKTNTPEAGLGTLTFNPVRGVCRKPWDLSRHAGGSSGGAGAALAAGMLPIADGSDSGGSIRYPASLCNIVGLRPTPGTVPSARTGNGWDPHGVLGPMARDSRDAARLLSGITGRDDLAPLSWVEDPALFLALTERDPSSIRLGWSEDIGGLPIDPEVRAVLREARRVLESAGVEFVEIEPDFEGADESWQVIEMFNFGADGKARFDEGRTGFRDDYLRNVAEGRALTADAYAAALAHRTVIFRRTAAALHGLDGIVFPATPVAAPPAEVEWVAEVDGTVFERYFLWQRAACRLTVTGHPVLATPAGFTGAGLPVGMQIVGASRGDAALLSVGAALEDVLGHVAAVPTGLPA